MTAPLVELYIETGTNAGQVRAFEPGQHELTLGRNEPGRSSAVDVSFEDLDSSQSLLVSRQHLRLRIDDHGVYAMDLGSRNGTLADGQMLPPRVEVPLPPGARIHLAPPEGPSLIVRQRIAMSGWDTAAAEVQLLQESYRDLLAEHKQLQESHHALVAKLRGQDVVLPPGSEVDWQRCHAKLLDSLERMTFITHRLVDAAVDVKVHGNLQRVISNLTELQSLLGLSAK
ncbi:MAG: FHA domain-containing protein [Polyangia bacterium]